MKTEAKAAENVITPSDPAGHGTTAVVDAAADRLRDAATTSRACAPVRDLIGDSDLPLAYAVQRSLTAQRVADGGGVSGRKIGLTSPAVQAQLGVDQPDFGVLFDDMDVTALDEVPSGRLLQPKAEAEVAFVLGRDLDTDELTAASVRPAVKYAVAALEIVDSRVRDWDIRITDTIADNASSGLYVLGDHRLGLGEVEPRDVTMRLFADGDLVSEGSGDACLGDPLEALAWLARTCWAFGEPLRTGQVVLSGALGPMVPTPPGTTIRAELSQLGSVAATFARKEQA